MTPAEQARVHHHGQFGYDCKRRDEEIMVAKKTAAARKKAKILKSTIVYQGPVFGVRRDEVLEPGGVHTTREVITHSGSVVVLPVLPDGKIVLVRQYRHATRQYLWELVAGRMDGNETPKQGAARELLEETGYRAKKFRVFLRFWPTPGFLEEKMCVLLAEGLSAGEAQPEEDEKIVTKSYSVNQLKQMVRSNKIRDAKTIASLLYYFTFLR
jgi:ADP-ribose pyrophosphatase